MTKRPQIDPFIKYPKSLATLGDHIRKRRLDLKLTAREVSKRVGVAMNTVYKWEYHRESPHPRLYRKIVEFLGYEPDVSARRHVGEEIRAYRKAKHLSQSQLARILGVQKLAVRQWEKDETCPKKELFLKLSRLLDGGDSEEVR